MTLYSKLNSPNGVLHVIEAKKLYKFSFLDYVQGSTDLNVIVGIDFTKTEHKSSYQDDIIKIYEEALVSTLGLLKYFNKR